jgi:hypothetical protein
VGSYDAQQLHGNDTLVSAKGALLEGGIPVYSGVDPIISGKANWKVSDESLMDIA